MNASNRSQYYTTRISINLPQKTDNQTPEQITTHLSNRNRGAGHRQTCHGRPSPQRPRSSPLLVDGGLAPD